MIENSDESGFYREYRQRGMVRIHKTSDGLYQVSVFDSDLGDFSIPGSFAFGFRTLVVARRAADNIKLVS